MTRYYICGQTGTGDIADPFRPELVDELPEGVAWAACQEFSSLLPPTPAERFIVNVASDDADLHALLAYDASTNPNGYDWLEVAEDGTVSVHAA